MKELLADYARYNLWANTKITGFLQKLPPPLLDKKLISSFNTIRKTIYHMWDAEAIWYNRLNGTSFNEWPSEKYPGKGLDFVPDFLNQSALIADYVKDSTEESLTDRYKYSNMEEKEFSSRRSDTILHCMNHSTFHRGQIATMLRNVGFTELDSTDYVMYSREMKL